MFLSLSCYKLNGTLVWIRELGKCQRRGIVLGSVDVSYVYMIILSYMSYVLIRISVGADDWCTTFLPPDVACRRISAHTVIHT